MALDVIRCIAAQKVAIGLTTDKGPPGGRIVLQRLDPFRTSASFGGNYIADGMDTRVAAGLCRDRT